MLWAALGSAGIGVLLGLRLRVPALLAASLVAAVLAIARAVAAGLPWLTAAAQTLACIAGLQAGYLVGLGLAHGLARFRATGRDLPPAGDLKAALGSRVMAEIAACAMMALLAT